MLLCTVCLHPSSTVAHMVWIWSESAEADGPGWAVDLEWAGATGPADVIEFG